MEGRNKGVGINPNSCGDSRNIVFKGKFHLEQRCVLTLQHLASYRWSVKPFLSGLTKGKLTSDRESQFPAFEGLFSTWKHSVAGYGLFAQ